MMQSRLYVFLAIGKLLFGRHDYSQAMHFGSGMVGAKPLDNLDLDALLPLLSLKQRGWAINAIHSSFGRYHPWLARLCSEAQA